MKYFMVEWPKPNTSHDAEGMATRCSASACASFARSRSGPGSHPCRQGAYFDGNCRSI
jgi:hypothetical protein